MRIVIRPRGEEKRPCSNDARPRWWPRRYLRHNARATVNYDDADIIARFPTMHPPPRSLINPGPLLRGAEIEIENETLTSMTGILLLLLTLGSERGGGNCIRDGLNLSPAQLLFLPCYVAGAATLLSVLQMEARRQHRCRSLPRLENPQLVG